MSRPGGLEGLRIGIALPHYDFSYPTGSTSGRALPGGRPAPGGPGALAGPPFERVAGYARRAEALGFDAAWVSDHVSIDLAAFGGPAGAQATPEAWTMLSGLAVRTERIRLGTLVLANGVRPPALLAKMAATLDRISGGRLDLGLGAGWLAGDFEVAGLPFPAAAERLEMLEEALDVLRAMLGGPASYTGRHYRLRGAQVQPGVVQQPRPPLWVGGRGDRLLGVVARAADGWNLAWGATPEGYAMRAAVLDRACAAARRDPADVRRSLGLYCLAGRDPEDLGRRWERLRAWAPPGTLPPGTLRAWAGSRLVGTGPELLEQLRGWRARGVEQVICSFANLPFAVFDDEQPELFAELVLGA